MCLSVCRRKGTGVRVKKKARSVSGKEEEEERAWAKQKRSEEGQGTNKLAMRHREGRTAKGISGEWVDVGRRQDRGEGEGQ